ncbi:unnamed protein product [Mytilus coruscus]|uniref:Uncharacterized protein n=1 Tax=Mytilus coruscus TaxID=42192 RepID=A0A6J8B593_MYTCO|nr:unnamed protein product [Mytilus coruscus]
MADVKKENFTLKRRLDAYKSEAYFTDHSLFSSQDVGSQDAKIPKVDDTHDLGSQDAKIPKVDDIPDVGSQDARITKVGDNPGTSKDQMCYNWTYKDNFKLFDTSEDKDYYYNMFDLLDLFEDADKTFEHQAAQGAAIETSPNDSCSYVHSLHSPNQCVEEGTAHSRHKRQSNTVNEDWVSDSMANDKDITENEIAQHDSENVDDSNVSRYTINKSTYKRYIINKCTHKKYIINKCTHKRYTINKCTHKRYTINKYTHSRYTINKSIHKGYTITKCTHKGYTINKYIRKRYTINKCTHKRYTTKSAHIRDTSSTYAHIRDTSSTSPLIRDTPSTSAHKNEDLIALTDENDDYTDDPVAKLRGVRFDTCIQLTDQAAFVDKILTNNINNTLSQPSTDDPEETPEQKSHKRTSSQAILTQLNNSCQKQIMYTHCPTDQVFDQFQIPNDVYQEALLNST